MFQTLRTHSGKLITLGLLGASLIKPEIFVLFVVAILAYKGFLNPFKSGQQADDNTEPEGYPDWVRMKYSQVCNLSQFAGKSYDHICNYILNNKQPS
jgi:hypothetical protein